MNAGYHCSDASWATANFKLGHQRSKQASTCRPVLAEIGHSLVKKCAFIEGMKERIDRHKDGSIKAKGHMMDGELEGYWEWFRLDGSKLRSGHFKSGKQVGEWTTYDATGKVVKVTNFPN